MALVFAATGNPAWQSIAFGSSTATFSAVAIGTAAADRIVDVGVGYDSNIGVTGMTIGGVTATKILADAALTNERWYGNVPSGTTANIVITGGSAWNDIGIVVGTLTGAGIATPSGANVAFDNYGNNSEPITATVTVPASGLGVVVAVALGGAPTPVWTNVDGNAADFTTNLSTTRQIQMAHNSTGGSQSPQLRASGSYSFAASMTIAAWGLPGAGGATPYNPWPQLGPTLAQRSRTGWTPKLIDWHRRQRPGRALLVPDRRLVLPQGFKKAA